MIAGKIACGYTAAFLVFFRRIQHEQDVENLRLQQCWKDLLEAIQSIYRDTDKCLTENGGVLDKNRLKNHVARYTHYTYIVYAAISDVRYTCLCTDIQ